MLARDTGIPASEHLGITDKWEALGFNLAVTMRMIEYDNEREKANRKFWVSLVAGSEKANEMFDDE